MLIASYYIFFLTATVKKVLPFAIQPQIEKNLIIKLERLSFSDILFRRCNKYAYATNNIVMRVCVCALRFK